MLVNNKQEEAVGDPSLEYNCKTKLVHPFFVGFKRFQAQIQKKLLGNNLVCPQSLADDGRFDGSF